jgi:response regulator of citrate/malate metabolism
MNDTPILTEERAPARENESASCSMTKKRGRPKQSVSWPETDFTFDSLVEKNVLSSSSLRKKMRVELTRGGILKVGTLKTAFGRPKNLYRKSD